MFQIRFGTSLLLVIASVLATAPPARAQVAVDLADPSGAPLPSDAPRARETLDALAEPALLTRMEEQLVQRASDEETSTVVTGIFSLVVGAGLLGTSIWLATDESALGGGFGAPNPAALMGLAIAPMLIAVGAYSLIGVGPNRDRLARWRAAMSGELTALELGRFEGELRAEANAARVARWGRLALGLGLAVGGVATMVFGAALDGINDELRAIVVGGGAGFTALGAVLVGTSFLESSTEQMWSQYRRGDAPESASVTVEAVIGPGGIGLVGAF